jgi:hypothetical protein
MMAFPPSLLASARWVRSSGRSPGPIRCSGSLRCGLRPSRWLSPSAGWTHGRPSCLTTAIWTSITGFGFPFHQLLPSDVVRAWSLAVLGLVVVARYGRCLKGECRRMYVVSVVVALNFNVFVLMVQAFQKAPALRGAAPSQSEVPGSETTFTGQRSDGYLLPTSTNSTCVVKGFR